MKWLLGFITLIVLSVPFAQRGTEHAIAQGQVFCQTRPVGTDDNSCASTAFVQSAIGGGGTVTITNGTSPTSGFTNNYVLTSVGNIVHQVIGSTIVNGVTCALGGSCIVPPGGIANVSGSAQNTTGTIGASSAALTLVAAKDFVNGEGIRINHAGAAFSASPPTAATVTPHGTTGSTSYTYQLFSIDAHGGFGAAITGFSTGTGNATLSASNYNLISFTGGAGTAGYGVCKTISGVSTFIGIVQGAAGTVFVDQGLTSFPFVDWIPTTCPTIAAADALTTTISMGGGTTSLTLGASAITAVSGQGVFHDDSAAIQAAVTAGGTVSFPVGTFYIDTPINLPENSWVTGQFQNSKIQSVFVGQNVLVNNNANQDRISNLSFYLVPGSTAITEDATEIDWVDNIWCLGGAVGGSGQPNCIYMNQVFLVQITNIFSDGWVGTTGFGSGGAPAVIDIDYGAINNTQVAMSNITIINDQDQQLGSAPNHLQQLL